MESTLDSPTFTHRSERLLIELYNAYRNLGIRYIYNKTTNRELAEDLVQDAFVRLLECKQMLHKETIKAMLFTTLRNLLYDYLRQHYCRQELTSYLYNRIPAYNNDAESTVIAADLLLHEQSRLKRMPPQRRLIYAMSRNEDKSPSEIALELNLSQRTVENHLFIGRKEIRKYIRQCI